MEIRQSGNISDPSRVKNPVPLRAELPTLRRIRTQKQQLARTLADQMNQAKEAHAQIQSRHDGLLQEIEALKSELAMSQDYIYMLERQQRFLQEEEARLAGLLHPIRRCSKDILRTIFSYAAESDDYDDDDDRKDSFRTATNLSHVCKSWREIALEMSSLWRHIFISTEDSINDIKSLISRTLMRAQSSRLNMDVLNIGEKPVKDTKMLIKALSLNKFKEIRQLYFSLRSSKDIAHISEATLGTSLTAVKYVWIDSKSISHDYSTWDCTWILRQPMIDGLQLEALGTVRMTGTDSFLSIRYFHLTDVRMPTIASHLSRLPNLKGLTIVGEFKMDPVKEDIIMANLTYLKVEDVDNFPWDRLSAPRLEHVVTNDEDKAAVPFFCRHPSICCLEFDTLLTKESFKKLACHLTNATSLDIGGEIGGLFKQISPKVPFPPFPRLDALCIEVGDAFNLSLQDVEEFIRLRCLPSPGSKNGDITRLYAWTIQGEPRFIEHAPWRTSPLVLSSQSDIDNSYDEPWYALSLIWPDS